MREPNDDILNELAARNRTAALRRRGASTGRVQPSAPRPLGRRKPPLKTKPRARPNGPGTNSETAKANARASIEARRQREGDVIADAVLGILRGMAKQ